MHRVIRPTRRPSPLVALVAVLVAFPVVLADDSQSPPSPPGNFDVRFTDGSTLKLTLKDARLEIVTPYGKLSVPVGEIQKIDFATRLTDDATRRIEDAIPNLGHPQFAQREAASGELLKLREKAYAALLEAARSKDAEVSRRAADLLDRIRDVVPADLLEVRRSDVIQTADSKFAGRIEGASLRAASAQFGDVQLKLTDMRSLRVPGLAEDEAKVAHAEPDPGTLVNYQTKVGESFHFKVTGAIGAIIWGTDVYTTDSQLATAAVHAGVLRAGQTGVVKVTIVASPPVFVGSTRHGVTSLPYGPFAAGYKVSR
jgi:hypothetical protein